MLADSESEETQFCIGGAPCYVDDDSEWDLPCLETEDDETLRIDQAISSSAAAFLASAEDALAAERRAEQRHDQAVRLLKSRRGTGHRSGDDALAHHMLLPPMPAGWRPGDPLPPIPPMPEGWKPGDPLPLMPAGWKGDPLLPIPPMPEGWKPGDPLPPMPNGWTLGDPINGAILPPIPWAPLASMRGRMGDRPALEDMTNLHSTPGAVRQKKHWCEVSVARPLPATDHKELHEKYTADRHIREDWPSALADRPVLCAAKWPSPTHGASTRNGQGANTTCNGWGANSTCGYYKDAREKREHSVVQTADLACDDEAARSAASTPDASARSVFKAAWTIPSNAADKGAQNVLKQSFAAIVSRTASATPHLSSADKRLPRAATYLQALRTEQLAC